LPPAPAWLPPLPLFLAVVPLRGHQGGLYGYARLYGYGWCDAIVASARCPPARPPISRFSC